MLLSRSVIRGFSLTVLILALVFAGGCSSASKKQQEGVASWYGPKHHGKTTASGQPFDQNALTAAHPSLPFGTQVRVTNLANSKQVVVTINPSSTIRAYFSRNQMFFRSTGAEGRHYKAFRW